MFVKNSKVTAAGILARLDVVHVTSSNRIKRRHCNVHNYVGFLHDSTLQRRLVLQPKNNIRRDATIVLLEKRKHFFSTIS